MQLESAYLSCPLCKQQMPGSSREQTLNTRLCGACQSIVLTAFRGGNSVAKTSPQSLPVIVQSDLSTLEPSLASTPSFFELTPADAAPFAHEFRSPMPFDPVESVKFNFYQEDDSPDSLDRFEPESSSVKSNGSGELRETLFEALAQTNTAVAPQQAYVEHTELISQPAIEEAEEPAVTNEIPGIGDNAFENSGYVAEAVPQYHLGPGGKCEYSTGEFPIFIAPPQQKSFSKLRWVIAAGFVVATAAALYFFVYRPSTPQEPTIAVNSPGAASVDSRGIANGAATASSTAPAKPVEQPPPPASAATETSAREAAAASVDTQGRFSLQAAAFPTQGGADEFAGRLKQVGLASYVVPANLARRGRWFRVRVGRFSSAEDAQKFAGEAQQRARIAGLAVQLIVCQYDQP